jgi:hypothetical protein
MTDNKSGDDSSPYFWFNEAPQLIQRFLLPLRVSLEEARRIYDALLPEIWHITMDGGPLNKQRMIETAPILGRLPYETIENLTKELDARNDAFFRELFAGTGIFEDKKK